ncbi:L-glutaminase [Kribbella sp. VKM Ac-2571]|uniref:glutaminase A n=1 Tax=Kribbella sp. VKM Ac-2571 TaxID=2512222 RepID=UPI00105E6B79|nr:glutaminase A [Kribbella sp. VKM Ac-2571]TDO56207.1 L-glutaminase [Kribbella sp. VKM Ac-2571]
MDVAEKLLRSYVEIDEDGDGRIWSWELLNTLGRAGIMPDDPRVRAALDGVRDAAGRPAITPYAQPVQLDFDTFAEVAQHGVIQRTLTGDLAVPADEFAEFAHAVERIHADLLDERSGEVADYIPTLRDADPEKFGIAICTADGQVFSIGDTADEFSVQSTSKPFSYAIALEQLGPEEVHRWIGQEQSGGPFNDPLLSLSRDGRPHNPMINAGAIGTLALVDSGKDQSGRLATVQDTWRAMTGERPQLHGATFLAERDTGFGNVAFANALAKVGKLYGAGPTDRRAPEDATEFYTMVCSLTMNAERLAKAGATLANSGVAPLSGQQVFSEETAARVLSVMGHSGMYNDSGQFSNQVGLPAKSGVSGNVMMVVPSKRMAVVVFSPRLDAVGNSVRGVEVCKRLVNEFGLHPYRGMSAGRVAAHQLGGQMNEADKRAELASAADRALGGVARAGSGGPAKVAATDGTGVAVKAADTERAGTAGRRAGQPGQQL